MFPTSSRPQHNSSNNNTAMPLEVKHLHDACERSMRHFNSGLTNDEQNRHRIALEEYNKAIAIVDSTLQTLRLTPQQWDWSNGQPKEWKRKMMKHRHLFSGRRDELQRNIIGETGSHTQNRSISSHDPHRRQHQQTNMMMTNIASMAPQTSSTTTHIQESEGGGMLDKVISFFGFGSGSSPSTTAANMTSCPSTARAHAHFEEKNMQQQQQQQVRQHVKRQQMSPQRQARPVARPRQAISDIPEFRGIDRKLLNSILDEVMETNTNISWDDIAGLKDAKQTLIETVVWPSLRPDLFSGLRKPARGVLLFGPPGNGKTMIAKAVASQCNATFFSISASAIVSKYLGEGEKIVRALFAAARHLSPSVIFIDEVDSMLTARSSSEHEASRRIKTEFLVQMDGVANDKENERVLVLGATNRPDELDEAVLRRFIKRIMIPLPDTEARIALLALLLRGQKHSLSNADIRRLSGLTKGFSSADMRSLCAESAMVPLRELNPQQLLHIKTHEVRPINYADFTAALTKVKPSVSAESLRQLERWNMEYGSFE